MPGWRDARVEAYEGSPLLRGGADSTGAVLPAAEILAAAGGITVPALIHFTLNGEAVSAHIASHETLVELPPAMVEPLFALVREIAAVVPAALGAEGTFVAMNNVVSQSVPHLHTHVVPRRFKDGLRGFFWPRQRYESDAAMAEVAAAIAYLCAPEAAAVTGTTLAVAGGEM